MSANSPLLPGDQTPSKAEATLLMPIFTGSGTSPFTTHVIPSPTASQSSAPNVAALPDSEDEPGKTRKNKRYSPEEDAKIVEGFTKFEGNYFEVIRWAQLDRTVSQVKNRYRLLTKKSSKPELSSGSTSTSPVHAHPSDQHPPSSPFHKSSSGDDMDYINGADEESENSIATDETPLSRSDGGATLMNLVSPSGGVKRKASTLMSDGSEEPPTKMRKLNESLDPNQVIVDKSWHEEALKFAQREKDLLAHQAKAQEELISQLKAAESLNRQFIAEKATQEASRLGHITYVRSPTHEFEEQWHEGSAFKSLKEREKAIDVQKEAIERLKKKLTKQKLQVKTEFENDEIFLKDQICKTRLNHLKNEQILVEQEREQLYIDRALHLKELKRINDEESSQFNDLRMLNNRYLLLQLLGKGGFSEVYKAYDVTDLKFVACKIHQLNPHWHEAKKQNYTKHACREYTIHKQLQYPRVVQMFDVFSIDRDCFCTVLEYCQGGDLDTYLKKIKYLSEPECKLIASQIFDGLKYLNEQKRPIIHYDLKPGNILFDSDGAVKITDFGLSKIMEEHEDNLELTSQGAGTYWYLPPECFETGKKPPRISPKVDVWSVGVIVYQMLYGKKPFGNNLTQQRILQDNVIGKDAKVDFPALPGGKKITNEAKNLVMRCLTTDQDERPDVYTLVKEEPFLQLQKKPKAPTTVQSASSFANFAVPTSPAKTVK